MHVGQEDEDHKGETQPLGLEFKALAVLCIFSAYIVPMPYHTQEDPEFRALADPHLVECQEAETTYVFDLQEDRHFDKYS